MIGFDRETAYIRAMAKRHPILAKLRYAFRADSNLAQLAAIRAGVGIGICQVGIAAGDPALVRVLPSAIDLSLETFVAMHEDLRLSPRYRAVFEALVTGLKAAIRPSSRPASRP